MQEEKNATIYDIARQLGIASSTVSRGLQNHPSVKPSTRAKIQEAARQMGYQTNIFAQVLRRQKTKTLGVILPALCNHFASAILDGMASVAQSKGYAVLIGSSYADTTNERQVLDQMYNRQVDGILLYPTAFSGNEEYLDVFYRKNIPVIMYDATMNSSPYPTVVPDYGQSAYQLVSHLVEQGCRKLILVTGDPAMPMYTAMQAGFKKACISHGLPFDPEKMFWVEEPGTTTGGQIAEKIMRMDHRPDGIIIADNACASGCLLRLQQANISVPAELALACINSELMSAKTFNRKLTMVSYPGFSMGVKTTELLIDLLENGQSANLSPNILLEPVLKTEKSSMRKRWI